MSKLTVEQVQSTLKIPAVLLKRSEGMTDIERTQYVYNMAIDDAANFAMDMAKTTRNTAWFWSPYLSRSAIG